MSEKTIGVYVLGCSDSMDRREETQAVFIYGPHDFRVVRAAPGKHLLVRYIEGAGRKAKEIEDWINGDSQQVLRSFEVYIEDLSR